HLVGEPQRDRLPLRLATAGCLHVVDDAAIRAREFAPLRVGVDPRLEQLAAAPVREGEDAVGTLRALSHCRPPPPPAHARRSRRRAGARTRRRRSWIRGRRPARRGGCRSLLPTIQACSTARTTAAAGTPP